MQKKLPLDLGTNLLGYFLFLFFPWLLTIIVGKYYGAESLGELSLTLSICTPVFILFSLQLRNRIASDSNLRPHKLNFLKYRISLSMIAIMTSILIGKIFYATDLSINILLIISFWKFLESISDMFFGFLQKGNHLIFIGTSQIFKYLPAILIIFIFVYFEFNYHTTLVFSLIPLALILFLFDYRNYRSLDFPKEDHTSTKDFYISSIPLAISASVSALNMNIPRYFLGSTIGKVEVGYFTACFVIFSLFLMIINFFLQLYLSQLKSFYESNKNKFHKFSILIIIACFLISLIFLFITNQYGGTILSIIYGTQFESQVRYFELFGYLGLISYPLTAMSYLLLAKQNIKIQFPASCLSLILILIGLYLFRSEGKFVIFWALGLGQLSQLILYIGSFIKNYGNN